MKRLLFISGLGADERVFKKIQAFTGYHKHYIEWEINKGNESLTQYAQRLISKHNIIKNDIIIGLSFGGMVTSEIAKIVKNDQIILISSLRDVHDLYTVFQWILNSRAYKIIPDLSISRIYPALPLLFNIESAEGKKALKQMLQTANLQLIKWSLEKIRTEKSNTSLNTIVHNILGSKDRLIKLWHNKYTHIIPNRGHFMVFENANEINKVLENILLA